MMKPQKSKTPTIRPCACNRAALLPASESQFFRFLQTMDR